MVLQQRKVRSWFKNNYNFITRFANRKRNSNYMRSKKKEKKIYIYKLIVTIIFALAIVFVLNTAQNYIRSEITGKTNLVINNGNVTKSIKNDVIVEDDVVYLSTKEICNIFCCYIHNVFFIHSCIKFHTCSYIIIINNNIHFIFYFFSNIVRC